MPAYEYECASCGTFTMIRPMSAYAAPADCPACGASAARMIALPSLPLLDPGRRHAHATNERSAHAPARAHAAGCACCKPAKSKTGGSRPWMISH